jgi:hypothetical protein
VDFDLTELLQSWPYDGENPSNNFRLIQARDGRALIQVREPVGIQQLEYMGRPDGARPQGMDTWLDYYEQQAESDPLFSLSHEDCLRMIQEGILYYQRYLILYQMEDWEGVARDTGRNIRYFDFVKEHADNAEDSHTIEQYRPYILRMNSIANCQLMLKQGHVREAADLLKSALRTIRELEPVESLVFRMELEKSVKHLQELIGEIEGLRPESLLEKLNRQKDEAILREDFELAARLRDKIKALEAEYAENR